jgi:pimeloyl-ACP methyl ester carboxylesterase
LIIRRKSTAEQEPIMKALPLSGMRRVAVGSALGILLATLAVAPAQGAIASDARAGKTPKPTMVLVHGDWADASSWSGVVARLQHDGYNVVAPPDPLRSLSGDSAYLATYLHTITGPVVLVGHSYGAAVITNAATGNPNVQALVYVDGLVPDEGQTVQPLAGPDSALAVADPTTVFNFVPATLPPSPSTDLYLKRSTFPPRSPTGCPRPRPRCSSRPSGPAPWRP